MIIARIKKIRISRILKAAVALLFLLAITCLSRQCLAAYSIEITGYSYQHNFTAGESVTISLTVKNTGDNITGVYFSPILTNSTTGAVIYPTTPAGVAMTSGETRTFSINPWTAIAGKYSVTLVIYGSAPTETEVVRESGAYSIRVGSGHTAEVLKTFPTSANFGVIPYGRYMQPVPLEITYDFFLYNVSREQKPWYLRIYTDNSTRYKGIENSVYKGSGAGFVSSCGRYTIPIRVWCLNYPPEDQEMGWDSRLSGPPTVDDDTYWKGPILDDGRRFENKAAWLRIPDYSEMTSDRGTWRNLIGQDIYDTQYVTDVNPTGDFTLKNPFSTYFATETSPASVKGNYSCNLIIEIYSP